MLQFLVVLKRLTIFFNGKNIGKRLIILIYIFFDGFSIIQTKIEPIIVTQKG